MQVLVVDPTQEIARRAEHMLSGPAVSVAVAGSLHGLALADATAEDTLIVRVRRGEEIQDIAKCLRQTHYAGRTFLIVDRTEQLNTQARLEVPWAESLQFSPLVLDMLRACLVDGRHAPTNGHAARTTFHGLVGRSRAILDVCERVEKAATGEASVCIYGESGTGKELLARAIHAVSDRRHGPLVTFDCTAVPEGLAESQLFGHVRGAFTGAIENRDGVFAQADGGTLFIDELCELGLPLQAKLLRVVQGREFVKVGGTKPIRTNIRLVTATNRDPKQAVDAGLFRADLYYRVAVVMIRVPPLRERPEDIPLLVEHFLARYAAAYKKPIRGVHPTALERMTKLPWPGNVRQLENFLAQAVVLVEGDVLTERDLFVDESPGALAVPSLEFEPGLPLREVERRHILHTLQRSHGNRTEAAKLLGISVRCLQYKLKAYAQVAEDATTP